MARIPKPHINKPQMETFHTGHATSLLWTSLPSPVTMIYSMVVAGSITGFVWYIGDTFFDGQGQTWMYITIGVMTVLALIGLFFNYRRNKKKAQVAGSFEKAVKGSAAGWDDAAPAGNDPAEIARLDNLRKQFQKGIDAFKDYGKDFYSLPWYVMVGEPGSGKTEAIRHSDLRFPETLQDMLQGTGGTYSMDWWFTNQAVLLDTAGAMLMNPEATKRFEEFLKLLRTYRPDCPVNGVILAIPVDSLLGDNAAKLEEKARRISQQFGIIQKALDVRFPIYLMVTKSDRLPGFREFTDAAGQQTFDREMLGWSNPADLDTPFDPANIGSALECIADRLKGRRLTLLADPIPRQAGSRRVDEVDSLFGFPETILSLEPRLKRYLEIIFQTGTWATLPPFFRGVYFTSAMNEGAALDEQLASALGMSIETLPGGGLFNRDKSVYLRDVFTEKVFKERGLVTRLKDIGRALRRKLVWFYATTAILLLLLLGLAWMVKRNVENELELERENWRVANATWGNGAFLPIVTRMEGADAPDGSKTRPKWVAAWQGDSARVWKNLKDGTQDNLTKIQFLTDLEVRTSRGLPGASVFRVMPAIRDFERRRRIACLAVFEGSVLKPVIDGVREKLVWDGAIQDGKPVWDTDSSDDDKMAKAFAAMIRMESWVSGNPEDLSSDVFKKVLTEMVAYLTPEAAEKAAFGPDIEKLADIAARLYLNIPGRKIPPVAPFSSRKWIADGRDATQAAAIKAGSDRVLGWAVAAAQTNAGEKAKLTDQRKESLARIAAQEEELLRFAREPAGKTKDQALAVTNDMEKAGKQLDKVQGQLGKVTGQLLSTDLIKPLVATLVSNLEKVDNPIYEDLKTRLQRAAQDTTGAATSTDDSADDGLWRERLVQYQRFLKPPASSGSNQSLLIGRLLSAVKRARQDFSDPKNLPKCEYIAPKAKAAECKEVCDFLSRFLADKPVADVLTNYLVEVRTRLDQALRFPLVDSPKAFPSEEALLEECRKLKDIESDWKQVQDAEKEGETALPEGEDKKRLMATFQGVAKVIQVRNAICRIDDTGAENEKMGLFLYIGAHPTATETVHQVPSGDFVPNGGLPPPPREVKSLDGIVQITVTNGAFPLYNGKPTENSEVEKKLDPTKPFSISVREAISGLPDQEHTLKPKNPFPGSWQIVRLLIQQKGELVFGVGPRGKEVRFAIRSKIAPPTPWPKRSDFPLSLAP